MGDAFRSAIGGWGLKVLKKGGKGVKCSVEWRKWVRNSVLFPFDSSDEVWPG